MSLYASYDMAWCEQCKGQRPHSARGRCLSIHRTTPLLQAASTGLTQTPLKAASPKKRTVVKPTEQNDCGCTTLCQTGCILFGPCPPQALKPKPARPTKKAATPRRKFDQTKVRAAVAALLAGEVTLQQAARDVGCDTEYLHGRAWKAAKDATSKRDDGRCQHPLHASELEWSTDTHHRIGKGSGGASNPLVAFFLPNLITLCRTHHRWVTDHPIEATALGLVIPRGIVADPSHVPAQTIHGLTFYTADGSRRIVPDNGPAI